MLFHQFGEIAKEVEAIVRTWRGLRVALDGKNGQFSVVQALDAIVVEVEASDFEATWQRVGRNAPAVVFRGDQDPVAGAFLDRLIGPTVPELEALNFRAKSQAENLVAQADAEDRLLANEALTGRDRVVEGPRVARSVGEKDAVRL